MDSLAGAVIQTVLAVYVGYSVVLFVLQRRFLFPGEERVPSHGPESDLGPGGLRVRLEMYEGLVEGWYFSPPPDLPSAPALIFAHGNYELLEDWTRLAELTTLGLGVLLIEYPGYGHSGGTTTREEIAAVFRQGYDWLVERPEVDAERIVAMGRSIGGGVATDLAGSRPIAALILQSTFTSVARLAWEKFRAPGFVVSDDFNNLKALRSFDGPVLLMHGIRDEVIAFSHARRLAAARPDAELIEWDCGHSDCPPDWDSFVADVAGFLRRHGLLGSGHDS